MNKVSFEIVIPVFNEGEKVLKLMELFERNIKNNFRVLFCYDLANDNIFELDDQLKKFNFEIKYVKNPLKGPCSAIKEGFKLAKSDCVIVYPADDFLNYNILDKMYNEFLNGSHIVAASRFAKGGSMKGCPIIKSILVRSASFTLYYLSSIPIKDASNGFRLFSKRLLNSVKIESKSGFAYSLELLVKAERMKMKITQIPSRWEERTKGKSRFKVFKWFNQYLIWYFYGIRTSWFGEKKINLD